MRIEITRYTGEDEGSLFKYGLIRGIWLCDAKLISVFKFIPQKIIIDTTPFQDSILIELKKARKLNIWRWIINENRGNFNSSVSVFLNFIMREKSCSLYIKGE